MHERLAEYAAGRQYAEGLDDERTTLRRFLEFQRTTFATKLLGLTDRQLRSGY